jgi:ribosomal protein L7/L12
MARDRDWVDYTNLAANVVQTAQLGSINSKMRELAELELQKDYREQQEAAVAKHEDILRDAVFFYSEQLRDLEEVASQNPVAAYFRASHLKGTCERMPQFKASGFRKFEDKERLANVQRNCDRLIREGAARLKPDELEKCDRCITHVFERDDLLRLIAAQEQREQLAKDRESLPEWQAAKRAELERALKDHRASMPKWFRWVVKLRNICAVCTAVGLVWIGIVLLCYGTSGEPPLLVMLPVGLFWTTPVLFILYIVVIASKPERRRREFEKGSTRAQAEIIARGFELSQRESALKESEALYAKFGTTDSEGYRKMLRERDGLLAQMLGDFAKGFIERKLPRGNTSFSLLLVDVPSSKEIQVMMAVQESVIPNLTPSDAAVLIKALPRCLLQCVSKDRADAAARALEAAGAKVEIRPTA